MIGLAKAVELSSAVAGVAEVVRDGLADRLDPPDVGGGLVREEDLRLGVPDDDDLVQLAHFVGFSQLHPGEPFGVDLEHGDVVLVVEAYDFHILKAAAVIEVHGNLLAALGADDVGGRKDAPIRPNDEARPRQGGLDEYHGRTGLFINLLRVDLSGCVDPDRKEAKEHHCAPSGSCTP